jgi:hypothetical protein
MYGEENQLLASLCAMDAGSTLIHHFKTVDLAQGQILAEPLEQMHHVYFPYSGIISFLVPLPPAASPRGRSRSTIPGTLSPTTSWG